MFDRLRVHLPYAVILTVMFYILPLMIIDTGMAMGLLLILFPLFTLALGTIFGIRQGFSPFIAMLVVGLFFPSLFIYYNISAWVYGIVYGGISLISVGIGSLWRKRR